MTRLMKPQPGERCNDKIKAYLIQAHESTKTSKPYEIRGFEVFLALWGSGIGGGMKWDMLGFAAFRGQGVQNGHEGRNYAICSEIQNCGGGGGYAYFC